MSWFSVNHVDGVAHASIRDDIGAFNLKSSDFERALGRPERVCVYIDSDGGDGVTGINLNRILSQFDVEVLITGRCSSAAVDVAMSGRKIQMVCGGKMMIHSNKCYAYGGEKDLLEASKSIADTNKKAVQIICARTSLPAELVASWHSDGKDHRFTAEECLQLGLVDEMVDVPVPLLFPFRAGSCGNSPTKPKTEEQQLFSAWLKVFGGGGLKVRDKAEFGNELGEFFNHRVRETK